jgi:single-strand DNA-binding protein|tara:strand:+ start:600 stop:974 length:375 start_codon:yes stop_codon:yes gene_type:complete
MASVNKAILVGHVGKDPEIRTTASGDTVSSFSLATNSGYGDNKTTDWHNVIFFGKTADFIKDYIKKGSQIYVEGRIANRNYVDKNGVKKYVTEIKGYSVQALQRADSNERDSSPALENDDSIPF